MVRKINTNITGENERIKGCLLKKYYVRCKDNKGENASLIIEALTPELAKKQAYDIHKVKTIYNVSFGEGMSRNYLERKYSPYIKNDNGKAITIFS